MGRRLATMVLVAGVIAVTPTPAAAIVGGSPAAPGAFPATAEITFGPFMCTGTLIAPNWVLSAGHCGSLTGAVVASPVSWPALLINVRVGGVTLGTGERIPVKRVLLNPKYLLTSGYDISLIQLTRSSTKTPAKVAGAGERPLWAAGRTATIAGFGATSEGGSASNTLMKANVPITTDAVCGASYSDFDVKTMVCAGFPQGGVDACQGDSGGPLYVRNSAGTLRTAGATSFGEGCARPNRPGVYARVADATLREWIRSKAPAGVN